MGKCYLLGAGFSKAVAGLPLMKELSQKWWEQIEVELKSKHENRVIWGHTTKKALNYLKHEWFNKWINRLRPPRDKIEAINFEENIEAILTWIDFITHPTHRDWTILMTDQAGEKSQMMYDTLRDGDVFNWKEVKRNIQTYMHLVLSNWEPKSIANEFFERIDPSDRIITFNYDMIPDYFLYKRGLWYPRDGYGMDANFEHAEIEIREQQKSSSVFLYKLHGSLNWEMDDLLSPNEIRVRLFDRNNSSYFPNYGKSIWDEPQEYQGAIDGYGILPTFMKPFNNHALLRIWARARKALENCEELVVIGYSFPEGDTAARLLFASCELDKKRIHIVDKDKRVLDVRENIRMCAGESNYVLYGSLEDFLSGKEFQDDRITDFNF